MNSTMDAEAPRFAAFPIATLVGAAGVVLAVVGALGPWARVPTYAASYGGGEEGAGVFWVMGPDAPGMVPLVGDGTIVLVMVALAGALVLWRMVHPPKSTGFILLAAVGLLLLSAVIGTVNWANPGYVPAADSRTYFKGSVEVGWGLIVMSAGLWTALLAAAYQLWADELR